MIWAANGEEKLTASLFKALSDALNLNEALPSYDDGKGVFVWNSTPHTTGLFDDFERAIGFKNQDDIDLPEQEKEAVLKLWKELFLIMTEDVSKGPFRTDDCCC